MAQFMIIGGSWGEGYKPGEIINAPEHAMEARKTKGEVAKVANDHPTVKQVEEEVKKQKAKIDKLLKPSKPKKRKKTLTLKKRKK